MVQAVAEFTKKPTILTYLVVAVWTFLASPGLAQTSAEYSLSAMVEGTAVVLELGLAHADLSTVSHEQPKFFYSEDAGATWLPIPSNCLTARLGADQPTWVWNPLSCLERKEWIGDKIRFKARLSTCVSSVTYHGYDYRVVPIGGRCWFAENLRSDRYRNGDPIPGNLSASQWSTTTSGAQAVYENKPANLAAYGRLYNWYAVKDRRGLCPKGFHVPSDGEWMTIEEALGGKGVAGKAMKATSSDRPSWNGSNASGFSGLPAGFRSNYGNFYSMGDSGYWWSSSPNGGYAVYRFLSSGYSNVFRYYNGPQDGFSVRCVRD
jgi:uncharacterized protein (TIGR02145 family)